MADQSPLANQKLTHTNLDVSHDLGDQFHPGRWLDRR